MKTVMKKLLSLMLVAVLLVSAVPFQASATETEEVSPIHLIVKVDGEAVCDTTKVPANGEGATVEDLLTYCFDRDWADKYDFKNAWNSTNQMDAYLVSTVAAGELVYVGLTTKAPETEAPTTEETEAPTTEETEAPTTEETEAPTTESTEAPTTKPSKDEDVVVGTNYITLVLDLNYEDSTDKYIKTLDPDDKMGVILESVTDPTREGYSFAGWYWDDDYDYKVKDNEYIGGKAGDYIRIYAKWNRKSSANNVFLKIYLNGKTSSAAKIVDISSYGDADGMIDIYEARRVVGNYYTAKDSAGLSYDGLFTDATWNRGAYNNSDESNSVSVNEDDDTYVYIMVYNAKTTTTSTTTNTTTSTGTADTTNPKTGDQIFMAVSVMTLSASALALFFFLDKKRAVK